MQTFSEFLPRRLTPAFRTVIAVVDQLDEERREQASMVNGLMMHQNQEKGYQVKILEEL